MQSELTKQILNLQQGDHLCLFYDRDPAEQMPALIPFIQEGLSRDEQCIYIADDQTIDRLAECLQSSGVNVARESDRGALKLWTRQQWRQPGNLSSAGKAQQVRQFLDDSSRAGFKGTRFGVEMTWTLGPDISAPELEHWEATINTIFVPGFPGRIVCQYNRSRLAPEVMVAALHTHPLAILGDYVCPNVFYQAPLILSGNGPGPGSAADGSSTTLRLDWMISQLKRARIAEKERESLIQQQTALAEARAGEARLRQLLSLLPAAVYTCDAEGRINFYNRRAVELWQREPLLNDDSQKFCACYKVFLPDGSFLAPDQTPMAAAVRHGKSFHNLEAIFQRPDGSKITVKVNIDPLYDVDGHGNGAINVFEDITERKRAEDASQRLAAIVESSEDAIVTKDLNGIITSWNRGAEHLFGYTPEEVIGNPITMLIPRERQDEEQEIIGRVRRGERVEHYETVRQRKDGSRVDISLTVSPLKNVQQKIVGASKIARDITRRKRAEEALQYANEQLSRANEDLEKRVAERTAELTETNGQLEAFVYSIAHDLRAPLRSMQAFSSLLLDDYASHLDDTAQHYARRILRAAESMDTLLLDLLAYGRVARSQIELTPANVKAAWNAATTQNDHTIREKNARVEALLPLPPVCAHEATLVQILANLLGNALKFVPPDVTPRVTLRAETRHDFVRLWVEDNGIGIAPDYHERIFRVFERLNGKEYAGTGIGLSIVRKGVERMGGRAGVESVPGQGSRFWVELLKA
jgi:PAS domain S-box-containing protein